MSGRIAAGGWSRLSRPYDPRTGGRARGRQTALVSSTTTLVSLGPLRPDGIYDIPPGVDPSRFPIVDVSVEPVDGDPTHSGDSVLRGELPL